MFLHVVAHGFRVFHFFFFFFLNIIFFFQLVSRMLKSTEQTEWQDLLKKLEVLTSWKVFKFIPTTKCTIRWSRFWKLTLLHRRKRLLLVSPLLVNLCFRALHREARLLKEDRHLPEVSTFEKEEKDKEKKKKKRQNEGREIEIDRERDRDGEI